MSSFVATFQRRFTVPNFYVHCIPSDKWYSLHWFVLICFCLLCSLASIIDDSNVASIPTYEEDVMEASVISQATCIKKVNPLYATILGQPFEGQGIDKSSDRWVLIITVTICSNFLVIQEKCFEVWTLGILGWHFLRGWCCRQYRANVIYLFIYLFIYFHTTIRVHVHYKKCTVCLHPQLAKANRGRWS